MIATVQVIDAARDEVSYCTVWISPEAVSDVAPAPSDLAVWYGAILLLRDGKYIYCRETPEELARA